MLPNTQESQVYLLLPFAFYSLVFCYWVKINASKIFAVCF